MTPLTLAPARLEGRFIVLEPLEDAHRSGLEAVAQDPETWAHVPFRADGDGFAPWFDGSLAFHASGTAQVYAVRLKADGHVAGSTSFLNIEPTHRRAEIGATWYAAPARGGPVNPEAKYLLLAHAFAHGAIRVELKTDARNARSRAAIAKLGAREEGILRRHTLMWDGYVRDTVYYSILDHEWPAVKTRLEARLAAFQD